MAIYPAYGDDFKRWCATQNKTDPPKPIVDALNADRDQGIFLAKGNADPWIYRNLITYLTGKGRLSNV